MARCSRKGVGPGWKRAPDGQTQLDQTIQHGIADRPAHLLREDNRSP
jgi:hypothetical protein